MTTLDGGTLEAVFAEARDPQRWREPIRNRRIAQQAQAFVDRALAEASTPIASPGFRVHHRYDVDGDRTEHSDVYFGIRRRLFAAAIGALLSDEVPISATEDLIWAICDEYTWALPAHIPELSSPRPEIPHDEIIDLFSAETAFALAEIIALLGERLHPLLVARAHREIERRVLGPFRDRAWFWETVETNWSSVCAASVGIAAMYLETDGLEGILDRCTAAMDALLAGYGDDGICIEGLNYWNYGFGHFAYYAEALRQRTGVDLWAGKDHEKLTAITRYPRNVALGGRAVAAFSDAEPYGMVTPALAALTERFDPSNAVPREFWAAAGWDHNWGPVVRQFAWARDAADEVTDTETPATWFGDAAWFTARARSGADEVGFAAKGGDNDEPHNHNDLGSFVLAVNGDPLLSELGMGYYDGFYFLPETRYETYSAGAQGHSVPMIAGVRQHHGRGAAAVVEEVSEEAGRLTLDLTSAYDLGGLQLVRRTFTFAGGTLTIDDDFAADEPVEIVDRLVSLFPIQVTEHGAVIRGDDGALQVTWSEGWIPRLRSAGFLTHAGDAATAHFLDLERTASSARCTISAVPVH
ncbi:MULTISPECIES: heparinase II/III family protein [unclassified Microbacterium]|uniref:heparinase II/III domain-containing protein n=1 Tax=unclassified Microbacterium TaxID=2609290 RepID=UPI0012F8EDAA|nr:heparinase II/III family protein [Microbacterium sp. MAH-37]